MEVVENIFLILAYVAAIGFLISGLDDLFFDSGFLLHLWRQRKKPHLRLEELKLEPEQWIALFVPAWLEGGVVNKMAEYSARVVLYEKYDIFIGVYPNDPETNTCVDEIAAVNPRIHKVVVPHGGPSSKADCLNWIYRAMRLNEVPGTREYQVIAIHDAEDVIHPLMLKLYNYFIPRVYDMGQAPVFALEHPIWSHWAANTYVDDFAELHTKDLLVREAIDGILPSAGVGTAFSRPALDRLAAENGGEPFRVGNLTEDYEVAVRVKRGGYRAGVINYPVDRIVRRRNRDGSLGPAETVTETVAVREFFPNTFFAAVRQRSRWILGITFQTWEQAGWAGTLPMRYTLLRDRRAPLTHFINMAGYLVLAYVLFQWAFRKSPWGADFYVRPILDTHSLLWKIAIIDTCLLGYRAFQRWISVYSVYNLKQAFASLPRVVVGNLINFAATVRAVNAYIGHKVFGKPMVWLKTRHFFPEERELIEYTKTIEDLLIEDGLATREQIFEALKVERANSAPLNLLRLGLLDEKDFTSSWAKHSRLQVTTVAPLTIDPEILRKFPESRSVELGAIPLQPDDGRLRMAFREPPHAPLLAELHRELGQIVRPLLARPSNIALVRARAYPRSVLSSSPLDNGLAIFRDAAAATEEFFLDAQVNAHTSLRSLPDVMTDMGMLTEPEARRLWSEVLGLNAVSGEHAALDQETFFRVGPTFWWLHRIAPIGARRVLAAYPVHSDLRRHLTEQLGGEVEFVAELPAILESHCRNWGVEFDPDRIIIDALIGKKWLSREAAAELADLRKIIRDPLPRWLVLQKSVTEEQVHECFLETSYLPLARTWTAAEANRLSGVFPPNFARTNRCFALSESDGQVTIGLAEMPSAQMVREIYDRLHGRPIFFQSLHFEDAQALKQATL